MGENPPMTSCINGMCKRQIRSVRNIPLSLMKRLGANLDEEPLGSIFGDVKAVTRSMPLIFETAPC